MPRSHRLPGAFRGAAVAVLLALFVGGCTAAAPPASSSPSSPIRVGVVLPLSGMPAELAGQERLGIQLAADLVNADGGIHGRQLVLDVRDLSDSTQAAAVGASGR